MHKINDCMAGDLVSVSGNYLENYYHYSRDINILLFHFIPSLHKIKEITVILVLDLTLYNLLVRKPNKTIAAYEFTRLPHHSVY